MLCKKKKAGGGESLAVTKQPNATKTTSLPLPLLIQLLLDLELDFNRTDSLGVVHILRNHGGGGSLQMITVLHRGGPPNNYGITKGWSVK